MAVLTHSDSHGYSGAVYDGGTGKPMVSVAVSNGRDVVLTDSQGRFTLDGWCKADFVTVTVPTGYWSENYYIPVSDSETGYDFHLDRLEKDLTNHSFLQVTDSEVGSGGAGPWVDFLRGIADETRPAFIVHTGDICYIEGLKAHIHQMNSKNMGVPVRYVIGNHDYVHWGEYGEALFESIYGPVMYSFDVGQIHYIVTPIVYGDVQAKYTLQDVAVFLENDLKHVSPDKKVIVYNHNYCEGDETGFVLGKSLPSEPVDLKKRGLLAWVFGHWHYNYLNEIGGIFNITTSKPDGGGIDASPATVRSVVLEGSTLAASRCHYNHFTGSRPSTPCQWSLSLGNSILYSAPAVRDGVIYVGTVDDGWPKDCGIAAVHEETGRLLWKYRTRNSIKSDIRIVDDRIITQDTEGNVYCLDPTGKEIWTKRVELLCPNNSSNSIAVNEAYLYCGGQQHVYCLKISDGSTVWHTPLSEGNTSPCGFVLYENMLLAGAHWDKLYALDRTSGKVLWTNKSHRLSYFITTPAVYQGCVYAASWNRLYKIDAASGKTLQYRDFEDYTFNRASAPYAENGVLYLGTTDRGVVAVETESLENLWTFETGPSLIYTSPYSSGSIATVDSDIVPMGDNLCFGASDGVLYILDKNGKKLADFCIGSPVNQASIVDGASVIVADFSGNLTHL